MHPGESASASERPGGRPLPVRMSAPTTHSSTPAATDSFEQRRGASLHLASLVTAEELERHDDPAAYHHWTTSSGATFAAAPSDGFEGLPVNAVLNSTTRPPKGGASRQTLPAAVSPCCWDDFEWLSEAKPTPTEQCVFLAVRRSRAEIGRAGPAVPAQCIQRRQKQLCQQRRRRRRSQRLSSRYDLRHQQRHRLRRQRQRLQRCLQLRRRLRQHLRRRRRQRQ